MLAHQDILLGHLKTLFPGKEIHVNAMRNINVKNPNSDFYMEYDIWVPDHFLCFEFQDSYHYMPTWYFHNTQHEIQQKDNMARHKGMDLIAIPCWWPLNLQSIASAIQFQRPDLHLDLDVGLPLAEVNPPSLNPSFNFFKTSEMPHVGELMLASFISPKLVPDLAQHLWWVGEKYDGIRCCWNSLLRKAYTRYGRELELSSNFISLFPSILVDSELWFGRGQYVHSFNLVKGTTGSDWSMFRVMLFDTPSLDVRNDDFEMRYARLLTKINTEHPFNIIVARVSCTSNILDSFVQQIIEDAGEGIILQKSLSRYEHGRSPSLLKLKSSQIDQEGIVVAINDDSVVLQLPSSATLSVPKEHILIPTPSLGDIVTFSFEINSRRDVPVHPTIIRARTDVSWEDLVGSKANEIYLFLEFFFKSNN